MDESTETISNDTQAPLELWIEPWGDVLEVAPARKFEIRAQSDREGELEIDRRNGTMIVYLWPGCTAVILDGSKVVRKFGYSVSELPPGMSLKGFLGLMFGPTEGRPAE